MAENLSLEALKNASELVNTTLTSKGYITEALKFTTTDWDELIDDQPERAVLEKLQISDKIYNNDKNIINIIYSLTQAIDRHHTQHKTYNKTLSLKESTIEELKKRVELLELQLDVTESKVAKLVQVDQATLEDKIKRLERTNRAQTQELAKLKGWSSDIQTKYDVEMRKKNLEISQLRDKLLDTRNLSTTITYGKPLDFTSNSSPSVKSLSPEINSHILYNNTPTIDNSNAHTMDGTLAPILTKEYEGIATQLSELIENLIKENGKFANFITELNSYFSTFNAQLSGLNYKNLSASSLVNPSDEIDMNRILTSTVSEIDPFEVISKPLFSNVYKNYHYVSGLIDVVVANLGETIGHDDGKKELEKLKDENKLLYNNWHEAIKALEDWKKYRQS